MPVLGLDIERLIERLRNGERVESQERLLLEVKPKGAKEEISKACACLANSVGGHLVVGIRDVGGTPDYESVSDEDADRIMRSIYDSTEPHLIIVQTEFFDHDGGRVLIIQVPGSDHQGVYRAGGHFLYRVGTECHEMPTEELERRIHSRQPWDFTAQKVDADPNDVLDPAQIERARKSISDSSRPAAFAGHGDAAFCREVGLTVSTPTGDRATIAGIIIAGRLDAIRQFASRVEFSVVEYGADGVTDAGRIDLRVMSAREALESTDQFIRVRNRITPMVHGFMRDDVERFNTWVCREAVVNAIAHRDYAKPGAVDVHLYSDRLVVSSPGGFIGGVSAKNIISHPSCRRNPHLCQALLKIRLMEMDGGGVDKMFSHSIAAGKRPPLYTGSTDYVRVELDGGEPHRPFVALVQQLNDSGVETNVYSLLIMSALRTAGRSLSREDLVEEMRIDASGSVSETLREQLAGLEGAGVIKRTGAKRWTRYWFEKRYQESLLGAARKPPDSLDETELKRAVVGLSREHGGVTRVDLESELQLTPGQATRVIQALIAEKKLIKVGNTKGSRYKVG